MIDVFLLHVCCSSNELSVDVNVGAGHAKTRSELSMVKDCSGLAVDFVLRGRRRQIVNVTEEETVCKSRKQFWLNVFVDSISRNLPAQIAPYPKSEH